MAAIDAAKVPPKKQREAPKTSCNTFLGAIEYSLYAWEWGEVWEGWVQKGNNGMGCN